MMKLMGASQYGRMWSCLQGNVGEWSYHIVPSKILWSTEII